MIVLTASVSIASAAQQGGMVMADAQFTPLDQAVEHVSIGCPGIIVRTPRPGTQFADPLAHVPSRAESYFAKAARLGVTWLSDVSCSETNVRHDFVAVPPASAGDEVVNGETHWSGWEAFNTAEYVQTGYHVPTVITPVPGYSDYGYMSSAWAGIGGAAGAGTPLIQTGTEHDEDVNGATSYYFWYEIVGGDGDTVSSQHFDNEIIPIPGDDVGSVAIWHSDTGKTELSMCDFTVGGPCLDFLTTTSTDAPGNSVEWIVEAPTVGAYVQRLADFGSVDFYNACYVTDFTPGGNNTCEPISAGTQPTPVTLWQDVLNCLHPLAQPGSLTNGTESSAFDDDYYQPHQYDCN
jgi:hypothetical protein